MPKLARIRESIAKIAALKAAAKPKPQTAAQLAERAAEVDAAHQLLEAECSHDETRSALYNALRVNRTAPDGSWIYRWIVAVYDEYLVYEEEIGDAGDKLFKADYSIAEDGVATLSNVQEVRVEYVTVENPASSESGLLENAKPLHENYIELKERALRSDGTMQVKIIGPGVGSSGFYSREVIERDVPKVWPEGTHMMADHMTESEEREQPEGKIRNLAAVFVSTPYYLEESEAPDGEGEYVDVKPFADYAPMLEDKAEAIGVSINGGGDFSIGEVDGVTMPIIEKITVGKSVDFVTKAGRGGKIISLKEAMRLKPNAAQPNAAQPNAAQPNAAQPNAAQPNAAQPNAGQMPDEKPLVENTIPKPISGDNDVNEQDAKKLKEAEDRASTAETENARLKEAAILIEAKGFVADVLKGIEMPEMTRARLAESLAKAPVLKNGALDTEGFKTRIEEAAASEIEYLQKVAGIGDGAVRGLGGPAAVKESGTPGEIAAMRAEIGLG